MVTAGIGMAIAAATAQTSALQEVASTTLAVV